MSNQRQIKNQKTQKRYLIVNSFVIKFTLRRKDENQQFVS